MKYLRTNIHIDTVQNTDYKKYDKNIFHFVNSNNKINVHLNIDSLNYYLDNNMIIPNRKSIFNYYIKNNIEKQINFNNINYVIINNNFDLIIDEFNKYILEIENKKDTINFYPDNIKKVGKYFIDYDKQIFLKNKPITNKIKLNSSIIINNDNILNNRLIYSILNLNKCKLPSLIICNNDKDYLKKNIKNSLYINNIKILSKLDNLYNYQTIIISYNILNQLLKNLSNDFINKEINDIFKILNYKTYKSILFLKWNKVIIINPYKMNSNITDYIKNIECNFKWIISKYIAGDLLFKIYKNYKNVDIINNYILSNMINIVCKQSNIIYKHIYCNKYEEVVYDLCRNFKISDNPYEMYELQLLLKECNLSNKLIDCPICLTECNQYISTECNHNFCLKCYLTNYLYSNINKCALCNNKLSFKNNKLFTSKKNNYIINTYGTKIYEIYKYIYENQKYNYLVLSENKYFNDILHKLIEKSLPNCKINFNKSNNNKKDIIIIPYYIDNNLIEQKIQNYNIKGKTIIFFYFNDYKLMY